MIENNNLKYLFSAEAIRDKAEELLQLTMEGRTKFNLFPDKIEDVTNYVLEIMEKNYPDDNIPFHSRWGHFGVGNISRLEELEAKIEGNNEKDRAKIKIDLAVISVLLDAGAGPAWSYFEKETGQKWTRSEGLAVMSFRAFMAGIFSDYEDDPLRVDSKALQNLTLDKIQNIMQCSKDNPVIGLEGRLSLLKSLGQALEKKGQFFSDKRPGGLLRYLEKTHGQTCSADKILEAVLFSLNDIWPSRIEKEGIPLGDVWEHSLLGAKGSWESLIPFHKLSQWLSYSLIEPLEEGGLRIENLDQLTGLAEYRNGGLLVDMGLIRPKNVEMLEAFFSPSDEVIIEWRALTVALLDRIAARIREKKGVDAKVLPLVKVLEGGTWHAGRAKAKELREDMSPPFKIKSDGTVF
jgi:hypothetical protein